MDGWMDGWMDGAIMEISTYSNMYTTYIYKDKWHTSNIANI